MSIFGRQNRLVTTSKTFSGTSLDIVKTINAPFKSLVLTGKYTQATPSIGSPKYPTFSGNCKLYAGSSEIDIPVLKAAPGGSNIYNILTGVKTENITEMTHTVASSAWLRNYSFSFAPGNALGVITFGLTNGFSKPGYSIGMCSHFETGTDNTDWGYKANRRFCQSSTNHHYFKLLASDLGLTSSATDSEAITAFNNWIVAENAKGTPLKVWLVRNTTVTSNLSPQTPQTVQYVTRVYDDGALTCNKSAEVLVYGR